MFSSIGSRAANSVCETRNLRLTAIDSFFNFMATRFRCMVLRYSRFSPSREALYKKQVGFLKRMEVDALLVHLTETLGSVDAIMRSC